MDDTFKIFVDQLRDGHELKIQEQCSPAFLNVRESELIFEKDISVIGRAYLASDELVIQLQVDAQALIPCLICNEWVEVDIKLEDFYAAKPLAEIKGAIFDFSEILREEILLEVPQFTECDNGHCPKRTEIQKYLKQLDDDQDEEEGYHPFAQL